MNSKAWCMYLAYFWGCSPYSNGWIHSRMRMHVWYVWFSLCMMTCMHVSIHPWIYLSMAHAMKLWKFQSIHPSMFSSIHAMHCIIHPCNHPYMHDAMHQSSIHVSIHTCMMQCNASINACMLSASNHPIHLWNPLLPLNANEMKWNDEIKTSACNPCFFFFFLIHASASVYWGNSRITFKTAIQVKAMAINHYPLFLISFAASPP